jgi:hypothetical protein
LVGIYAVKSCSVQVFLDEDEDETYRRAHRNIGKKKATPFDADTTKQKKREVGQSDLGQVDAIILATDGPLGRLVTTWTETCLTKEIARESNDTSGCALAALLGTLFRFRSPAKGSVRSASQ